MAEHITKLGNRAGLCLWLVLLMPLSAAFAEGFSDPTRPPASLGIVEPGTKTSKESGPILQSVLISKGRKVAVINGQTVRLGDKFGKARLVSISETEVVLKSGKDVQTLKLFPDVEKRLASSRHRVKAVGPRQ